MDKAKEEAKNILDVRERLKLLDSLIDEARRIGNDWDSEVCEDFREEVANMKKSGE